MSLFPPVRSSSTNQQQTQQQRQNMTNSDLLLKKNEGNNEQDDRNRMIATPYGKGKVVSLEKNTSSQRRVLKLTWGATMYTPMTTKKKKKNRTPMELNVAYESLEKMRRLNLEMQYHELKGSSSKSIDHDVCTTCLLSQDASNVRFPRLQKLVDDAHSKPNNTRLPKLKKLWGVSQEETKVLPRIQKLLDHNQKARAHACLICASPTCPAHSSTQFRKSAGITLCQGCERMFELDFIVDCVSAESPQERAQHVQHMIDLYDRSLLLLKYSSQYMEEISTSLKQQQSQQNKIGLGSSSVGLVSGTLGIAAAATILTPAGPPLLIASLLFGGSATAVQTGSEVRNYYSEPQQLADRIIALMGISKSILRVTSTLRDAMMRDHIRTDEYETAPNNDLGIKNNTQEGKKRAGILAASNISRGITLGVVPEVVSAEMSAVGAARGMSLGRAGTAAARTMRFARVMGGALSAAVLVMEANSLQKTISQIKQGNPCEKADMLLSIQQEMMELPSTDQLDRECQAYLTALAARQYPTMLAVQQEEYCDEEGGATILEGEEEDDTTNQYCPQNDDNGSVSSFMSSKSRISLLERIQMHKLRESQQSSTFEDDDAEVKQQGEIRPQDLGLLI